MKRFARFLLVGLLGAGLPVAAFPAQAANVALVAHLLGATAHTKSDAFAEAQFTYDTESKNLDYYVNYDGATPVKVDLHGPARDDETGPELLSLPVSESPISGSVVLTADQAQLVLAGKTYIDIHSQAFPAGEIRGRIVKP